MKQKHLTLLALLLLLNSIQANAQSKFSFSLDYHHLKGITEKNDLHIKNADSYGNSLHFTAFYRAIPQLDLGAGIGADRYEYLGFNTLPVFAALRYYPLNKLPETYIYSNAGYSIKTDNTYEGALFDIGIGHQWSFSRRWSINIQLGYNLKQIRHAYPQYDDAYYSSYYSYDLPGKTLIDDYSTIRHSFSVGFGLIFR